VPSQSSNPIPAGTNPQVKTWPKDFYVIAESFSPKNQSGSVGRVYNYGEKIVLSELKSVLSNHSTQIIRRQTFPPSLKVKVHTLLLSIYQSLYKKLNIC
jgi:hypothetical protein